MANCTITPESLSAQVFSLNSFPVVHTSLNERSCLNLSSEKASSNKASLSHLPTTKREQLQKAVEVILESAHSNNASKPSMLILFGSYARGNWIEERVGNGQNFNYQSSFDLLAVTKNALSAKKLECKKSLHKALTLAVETPVNLIAEDIQFVNRHLAKGHYFYTDILRDGVVLYDSGAHLLSAPLDLPIAERRVTAEADFNHWFTKAMLLKKGFGWYWRERNYSEAAFLLHQIVERLYGTVLLVFSRYRPSSHDLAKLGLRIASIEPQFLTVFPQGSAEGKRKFELLRSAYVSARYNPSFAISAADLEWLASRVDYLQSLTEALCQAKIASYR